MARDSQTVLLSRQAILLVTAVGVGLLTLCYVLGVQVGKQSAALRHPLAKGAGEELEELPATMAEQLKALESSGSGSGFEKAPEGKTPGADTRAPGAESPAATPEAKADPARDPKAEKPRDTRADKPKDPKIDKPRETEATWTLQLVSTPDAAESRAVLARAKAAGFHAEILNEKGLYKVRLSASLKRDAADALMVKVRNHGFKPFAIKVDH